MFEEGNESMKSNKELKRARKQARGYILTGKLISSSKTLSPTT